MNIGGRIPHVKKNPVFMMNMENIDVIFKGEYIIKTLNPIKTFLLTDDFTVEEIKHNKKIKLDLQFDTIVSKNSMIISDNIKIPIDFDKYHFNDIEIIVNDILEYGLSKEMSIKWYNDVVKKNFLFVMKKEDNYYRYIDLTAKPNLFNRYTFIYKFKELLTILYNENYDNLDFKKAYSEKYQKQLLVDLEKEIMSLFEDETHHFFPANIDTFRNEKTWNKRFDLLSEIQKKSNNALMQRYVNFHDMISVISTYTDDIKSHLDKSTYEKDSMAAYKEYIDKKYLNFIENDKDIQTYNTYLLKDIKEILYYKKNIIDILDKTDQNYNERPSILLFMVYFTERLNKKQLALNDRGGNILPISFRNSIKSIDINVNEIKIPMYPFWTTYSYSYRGNSFAGCCETAVIETIKALSYNINKNKFDSRLLPDTTLPELKQFIDKYKPQDYGSNPMYNLELMENLLNIFENRPNIKYVNNREISYEFYSIEFFNILSVLFGMDINKDSILDINKNKFIIKIEFIINQLIISFDNNFKLFIKIEEGHATVFFTKKIFIENRFINGRFCPQTKEELQYGIVNPNEIPYYIGDWDVSRITDMSQLFSFLRDNNNNNISEYFDEDLSNWDVSNVTDMSYMFDGCKEFNQSLNNWNVSNVTNMSYMFRNCEKFNQSLNNWNVSNVTNMSHMFDSCYIFNQSLNNWNVSNVTNMSYMFDTCEKFNQLLNNWNVSKVTNMAGMFRGCQKFNQLLNNWNVSKVTNMESMIRGCNNFNQLLNNWNVSNVTNMKLMFAGCYTFNQPLNDWNVSNVTNMELMFHNCKQYNQPLNHWNVSNVTTMKSMFYMCSQFNQPLNNWNVSNVTNMNDMFMSCVLFNQPLNDWNVSNVTNMESMFAGCYTFNQPLNNWNVSNVTNMTKMFMSCITFNQPLNNWNVSKVTNMDNMFQLCNQFNQSLNDWNVSNVTTMESMFGQCINFNKPLNNWNVSNVTNMLYMFYKCTNFNQPLNDWNVSNVVYMINMFGDCINFNQSLNDWNVSNVIDMDKLFYNCPSFKQPVLWYNIHPYVLDRTGKKHGIFDPDYPHFDKGIGLLFSDPEKYKLEQEKHLIKGGRKYTLKRKIIKRKTQKIL